MSEVKFIGTAVYGDERAPGWMGTLGGERR